jgi:putative zinc finger/helix-turn-helix YgiT family protein
MNTLKPRKREPHVCMRCRGREVAVEHRSDHVDFKGLTLEVSGLAETVCKACQYRWTTEGQEKDNLTILREAFAKKRDQVRDREGLLTGEQIQVVLQLLGISKSEAAELFGGGPNAFSKYVRGEVLQSVPMDRLLRLTLAFGQRALALLKLGKSAPLSLNAGYHFASTALSPLLVIDISLPVEKEKRLWPTTSQSEPIEIHEFDDGVTLLGYSAMPNEVKLLSAA